MALGGVLGLGRNPVTLLKPTRVTRVLCLGNGYMVPITSTTGVSCCRIVPSDDGMPQGTAGGHVFPR